MTDVVSIHPPSCRKAGEEAAIIDAIRLPALPTPSRAALDILAVFAEEPLADMVPSSGLMH